ncbi:MAG: flagellar hook-associated protein FlgK [Terracidiphilus sp.]|nr:flagellar hook-associated protein FlgK [Terracidiphilus sp.]
MGTISSAFSLVSGALDADQEALNIVANNVANASTTGYTRETPTWQENDPVEINGVSYGTGVTETGATSVRDTVLEERLNQQQQLASASSSRLTALDSVQDLFTVASSSSSSSTAGDIGTDLTSFFSSFSSLEANPTENSARQEVLSSAKTLAGDVSSAAASLNSQKSALDQDASGVTSQVNSLTSALAQLNTEIQSISPDGDAGTLEDQRQEDLSQLSKLIGINQISTSDNSLTITTTSGQLLVSGGTSNQLTTGKVNGVTDFFVGGTDITSQLTSGGGELGGYLTARDQDIPSVLSSLDQLAYSVSTQVNALNNSGTDGNGTEGTGTNSAGVTGTGTTALYIFNEPTQVSGSAAAMSVVMSDPSQIAAAGLGKGTGNSTNATAMYNLSTSSIVDNQTPTNYYSNFVSTLGATVSGVETENTAQEASVTQLQTQNDSLSSVNLNDEASSLSTLERSYQAASKVFSMLDTIMASALNLGEQTTVS